MVQSPKLGYERKRVGMKFTSIHEAILDSMSDAVYVVDRSMRIQYANPAAEHLTGFTFDESVGETCDRIFCERSDLCATSCPPKRSMRDERPILHRDAETRTKTGAVRQTQISISPFFDNEICIGAVVVMKDITDLKNAEEQIRRQNRFLTDVIDALPHPFSVIDVDTHELKLVNKAMMPDALPDRVTCFRLSHRRSEPCDGAEHPCPLDEVKRTGKPVVVEHVHRDGDGRSTDVEVHAYPIFTETGTLVQMIEYCVDISERKRAMNDRERLIRDLQNALNEVKTLSGLLPICSACKKIRDDKGYWNNLEQYISERSEAEFSHGLCPQCAEKMYEDYYRKTRK